MATRIRRRSAEEQLSLPYAYQLIYNAKNGKIHPEHPWLSQSADRKNVRIVPRGKGTPRRGNKKLATRTLTEDNLFEFVAPRQNHKSTFPIYEKVGMTAAPVGDSKIVEYVPDNKPIQTHEVYPTLPIPVTYSCGDKDMVTIEVKPGLTLKEVQAAYKEILCPDCMEKAAKERMAAQRSKYAHMWE